MTKSIFVPENIGKKFRDRNNPHHVYTLLCITPSGRLVTSSLNGENIWYPVYDDRFELVPEKETRYILWYTYDAVGKILTLTFKRLEEAEAHGKSYVESGYIVHGITETSIEVMK